MFLYHGRDVVMTSLLFFMVDDMIGLLGIIGIIGLLSPIKNHAENFAICGNSIIFALGDDRQTDNR